MEDFHEGILKKFQFLKGEIIFGQKGIKGKGKTERIPSDEFVPEPHILHDLIRGFYKPAGELYLLSYQATEADENYGKQIIWDNNGENFLKINMHPPRGEKDNRKISDIRAARYNLENDIPFGILYKIADSQNKVLGLGKIKSEEKNGVFVVEPFTIDTSFEKEIKSIEKRLTEEDINTNILREALFRRGQKQFRNKLIERDKACVLCGLNNKNFLIASHIKPWRFSKHKERIDYNNGILLCPNHDKLFDNGYISFTLNGKILISKKLSDDEKVNMGINEKMSIEIGKKATKYFEWHRNNYFKA